MPELPDVERFRRVAAEHALNRRVETVTVHDVGVLEGLGSRPHELAQQLRGRYIAEPRRHGKWLVLPTSASPGGRWDPPCLLMHFGMTGMLLWCADEQDEHAHDRVVFTFEAGELRYRDMRKLKGIRLAHCQSEVDDVLEALGPDAAELDHTLLRSRLTRTRRQVKSALMDQSTVAGLGNLCVDEILWRARTHPQLPTTEFDSAAWRTLHRRMRSVVRESSRAGRVPDRPSWLTGHRDEPGGRCPRCSEPLRRDTMAGRGTVWCPVCQAR